MCRVKWWALNFMLICCLALPSAAIAQVSADDPEVLDLTPVADTFIDSGYRRLWFWGQYPRQREYNYGGSRALSIVRGRYFGFWGPWDWRASLIRFDLSSIPEHAEVVDARLSLFHFGIGAERISIHPLTLTWTEHGATWERPCENCKPWWAGWGGANFFSEPSDLQWVGHRPGWFSWEVTDDLNRFLSGDPNYGWLLKSAENRRTDVISTSFFSKEIRKAQYRPRLRIRYRYLPPQLEFAADPARITLGESATLSWSATHADRLILEPGPGNVAPSGTISVSPGETTEYTLTAEGPGGTVTETATVAVQIPEPTVLLTADPGTVRAGDSALLSWVSTHADDCAITPDLGSVEPNGQTSVTPGENTTYTITATGPGGIAGDTATVTVVYPPAVEMSADPPSIMEGESATLFWTSLHATSAVIDQGIGAVPLTGSITVSPAATTDYTVTVEGPGGQDSASSTVTVLYPPEVTLDVEPEAIFYGESATLSWTSANAEQVTLEPGIGPVAPQGSIPVSPTETTPYQIRATGPGGSAEASVTVTVTHPVPTVTISAEPQTILSGEASTLSWSSEHAEAAAIDNGVGSVSPIGSTPVSPIDTTTYTITAEGPGGTASAATTVTVTYREPTVSISATPSSIMAGQSAMLTWTSANADSLSIDQGIGSVDPMGSLPVSPQETTAYTVTATGRGGTALDTAILTVTLGPDEDSDGLPDPWEEHHFGGLTQDGAADPDGDRLTNLQEYYLGTDPNSYDPDTDDDNLPDWWELEFFGDLSLGPEDHGDGDMFTNWQEYQMGNDPTDSTDAPRPGQYYRYDALGRLKGVIVIEPSE